MLDEEAKLLAQWPGDALLEANLEALRGRDPELAAAIEATEIPDNYEAAVTGDGGVGYRYRDPEDSWHWLGACSLPRVFAEANVTHLDIGQVNLALNGAGHGADIEMILKHMASHQALFVFETNPLALHLIFRLRDYSRWLEQGQLVLLCGPDFEKYACNFFARHHGYNLIQKTVALPYIEEKENRAFAVCINRAMEKILPSLMEEVDRLLSQQRQQTDAIRAELAAALENVNPLRVSNTALVHTFDDAVNSRDALAGWAQLGARTQWHIANQPDCISGIARLEQWRSFRPHVIMLVNTLRKEVAPELPAGSACVTLWQRSDITPDPQHMAESDIVCVPDAKQFATLQKQGFADQQLLMLPPGINHEIYRPVTASPRQKKRFACDVALVANRPSLNPEDYHIKLPTQQKLFQSVIKEIVTTPEDYTADRAGQFLQRAQKCGITLKEKDTQDFFIRLIQNHLGEAALLECYGYAVSLQGANLKIWADAGLGEEIDGVPDSWKASELVDNVAGAVREGESLNDLFNSAKIMLFPSGRPGINRAILNAAAAGAFIMAKAHPNDNRPGGIGDFLRPGREIVTFDSIRDLQKKVKYYLQHEEERCRSAIAASVSCMHRHTMSQRMNNVIIRLKALVSPDRIAPVKNDCGD